MMSTEEQTMTIQQLANALASNYGNAHRTAVHNAEAHYLIQELNRRGAAVLAHITWIDGKPQRQAMVIFDGEVIRSFRACRPRAATTRCQPLSHRAPHRGMRLYTTRYAATRR